MPRNGAKRLGRLSEEPLRANRSKNDEDRRAGQPDAAAPKTAQCPLCGNRFEIAEAAACAHCPKLFKSCGLVMCPRCTHEFPRPR